MDVVFLSRVQFALTIGFHYLFPPLSIGLSLMLVIMEGLYLKTKNPLYKKLTQFWTKIFALSFALGVASGIVMVFAFGNNWARYSEFVGDVFGSALAAEGIFAFFLEAGFLGLMLFGWNRVRPSIHYLSTVLVSVGAHFSAVWITIANSWMQTPAGFKVIGEGSQARAVVTDWLEMIFNPSSMDRLIHVILGCWLTGAFIVISVSGYYLLKKRHLEFAKAGMKLGLIVGSIMVMLQLFSADDTARGVAKNQPEKLAAIEGVFQTKAKTPLYLFGWVDKKEKKVHGIKIPGLLSLLTYRNIDTPVPGLNNFDEGDWPNVQFVFQAYHLMIAMWGLMFLSALLGFVFWIRKTLWDGKWVLRLLTISVAFPYIANQAGWFTAEVGRQPWIVYRLLRTFEGVSRSINGGQVLGSILMFIVIYSFLLTLFIYLLNHKIMEGPPDETKLSADKVFSDRYMLKREG